LISKTKGVPTFVGEVNNLLVFPDPKKPVTIVTGIMMRIFKVAGNSGLVSVVPPSFADQSEVPK